MDAIHGSGACGVRLTPDVQGSNLPLLWSGCSGACTLSKLPEESASGAVPVGFGQ